MSTGLRNLLKLVGGWSLGITSMLVLAIYFEEIRTAVGLKLEPQDFGIQTADNQSSPAATDSTEPKVVIRYVDRPVYVERTAAQAKKVEQTRSRSSFSPSVELPRRGGHFHAETYVNGRPVEMLVDTGATDVVLTWDDARSAGLQVSEQSFTARTHTANGITTYAPVRLDDVRIGDITVSNVSGAVMRPGQLTKSLLGMSFLRQTRMQMRDGRLILEQ